MNLLLTEDLLRNQLSIVIHEAARLAPATPQHAAANATERITALFQNLLAEHPVTAQLREPVLKLASAYTPLPSRARAGYRSGLPQPSAARRCQATVVGNRYS